nr:MAG TPA: hypothetical protein [Bacteriophage sp.]
MLPFSYFDPFYSSERFDNYFVKTIHVIQLSVNDFSFLHILKVSRKYS